MSQDSLLTAQEHADAALAKATAAAEPKKTKPEHAVAVDALLRHLAVKVLAHDKSIHGHADDAILEGLLADLPETDEAKETREACEAKEKADAKAESKAAHVEAKAADAKAKS